MNSKIDMTIAEQVAQILRSEIRSGSYLPDSRLPGERKLSQRYGVCRSTIIAALDILSEEKLIKKIPARGNFILPHDLAPKILLLYPERTFGEANHLENISSFFEFYHGLLDKAAIDKIEISTLCITEDDFEKNPTECIQKVADYDVIIFPSPQLLKFRKALYGKKVLIVRCSMLPTWQKEPNVSVVTIDYTNAFKQVSKKAIELGFDKISFLTIGDNPWLKDKSNFSKNIIEESGLIFEEIFAHFNDLETIIPKLKNKFVFFNNMVVLGEFYHECSRLKIVPGKDFQLTGLCSGNTVLNLMPEPSYMKVPSYEIGQAAFQLAIDKNSNKLVQVSTSLRENSTIEKGKKWQNPNKYYQSIESNI